MGLDSGVFFFMMQGAFRGTHGPHSVSFILGIS